VTGLDCPRSEVSGRRLWKLFSERSPSAEAFFADTMVLNYCPLLFLEESGRNRTPDKLPPGERERLFAPCDRALIRYLHYYRPSYVVGIGAFATGRVRQAVNAARQPDNSTGASRRGSSVSVALPQVVQVLHPSPANPRANRDWVGEATRTLVDAGIWPRTDA
ncbi:MAG: single-stranded DNA-binding protein, partial [Spirochaetia bacterium]